MRERAGEVGAELAIESELEVSTQIMMRWRGVQNRFLCRLRRRANLGALNKLSSGE